MPKLRIKSTYPPAIWDKPNGSRVVVAGTIVEVNGKPWHKPYIKVKPFVTKDHLTWESSAPKISTQPISFNVKGSKGESYTVTRRSDGRWNCTCMGFHYRRSCRHVSERA